MRRVLMFIKLYKRQNVKHAIITGENKYTHALVILQPRKVYHSLRSGREQINIHI